MPSAATPASVAWVSATLHALLPRSRYAAWNLLRVLVQAERVRVWFNPQFPDVTGASTPPADEAKPPVPMPPRIDARLPLTQAAAPGPLRITAESGCWRLLFM